MKIIKMHRLLHLEYTYRIYIWYDMYADKKLRAQKGDCYMNWKNIYRGIMMGTSDLIPGVSGGTIAVLLGIYDELISSINGLFSKDWPKKLRFLIPLGIGMGAALLMLSKVMEWLLKYYPEPTYFLFLGLIIGIIPFLFKEAEATKTFSMKHYALLVVGALMIACLAFFKEPNQGQIIENIDLSTYALLFVGGFLASAAMILPGISGSMVFWILGVYPTVIGALSNLKFDLIIVIGLGVVIGIVTMSKVIHYFLQHYRTSAYALIIGSVIGSIVVVFPGFASDHFLLIASVVTFGIGLLIANMLGKIEYQEET